MRDFLDVKKRCHVIYEILRLRVDSKKEANNNNGVNVDHSANHSPNRSKRDNNADTTTSFFLPLPRACPKCGLLQHIPVAVA